MASLDYLKGLFNIKMIHNKKTKDVSMRIKLKRKTRKALKKIKKTIKYLINNFYDLIAEIDFDNLPSIEENETFKSFIEMIRNAGEKENRAELKAEIKDLPKGSMARSIVEHFEKIQANLTKKK